METTHGGLRQTESTVQLLFEPSTIEVTNNSEHEVESSFSRVMPTTIEPSSTDPMDKARHRKTQIIQSNQKEDRQKEDETRTIAETTEGTLLHTTPAKHQSTNTFVTPDQKITSTTNPCELFRLPTHEYDQPITEIRGITSQAVVPPQTNKSNHNNKKLDPVHSGKINDSNLVKLYPVENNTESETINDEIIQAVGVETTDDEDGTASFFIRNIQGDIVSSALIGGISDEDISQLFDKYFP
jgi:hypothetical protein